jgi:hypothetical protein
MTPGFHIRNHSNIHKIEVFISAWTREGGSDSWFTVASNLSNADEYQKWHRTGWEVVVFKDPDTGRRRGWYLNCENAILQLTFYGFEVELGLVKVR